MVQDEEKMVRDGTNKMNSEAQMISSLWCRKSTAVSPSQLTYIFIKYLHRDLSV